ncbi:hypothetical protein CW306_16345 [Bacillus sp. BA3]|nr:hypothetical protein CW306_16345 [Bacillus sp. BA3]
MVLLKLPIQIIKMKKEVMIISKYWSYKMLLTGVFIIAAIIFYKFGFTSEGLVYFVFLAILLSVLLIVKSIKKKDFIL